GLHLRLALEEPQRVELRRELSESGPPWRNESGKPLVILGRVGHVLPASDLAIAAEDDRRRHSSELGRHRHRATLRPDVRDHNLEGTELLPARHQLSVGSGSGLPGCSTFISRYTSGIAARIG